MASIETVVGSEASLSVQQFGRVRKEIQNNFSRAHQLLQKREAELLAEVQELEENSKESEIADEMKKIFISKENLQDILRGNSNKELLEQSCAPLDKKMKELQTLLEKAKNISLGWDDEMEYKLNSLGSLQYTNTEKKNKEVVPDYKQKGEPIAVYGNHKTGVVKGPGIFTYPNSITFDNKSGYYYICDGGNNRVQVVDKSLNFLSIFNEKMNGPFDICIHQDKLYVTQHSSNCLNVYSRHYRLLNSVGREGMKELEFKYPRGLAISSEWSRMYICEFHNHRVQCLNLDFSFNSFIPKILGANDVKLTPQEIVILCSSNPCVLIYNPSHQLSRQIITHGEGNQVEKISCFYIDRHSNILLSDRGNHCVLIFSYTGELICKFGKEGEGKGDFIEPTGITMNSDGSVVVVSKNPDHCIQMF